MRRASPCAVSCSATTLCANSSASFPISCCRAGGCAYCSGGWPLGGKLVMGDSDGGDGNRRGVRMCNKIHSMPTYQTVKWHGLTSCVQESSRRAVVCTCQNIRLDTTVLVCTRFHCMQHTYDLLVIHTRICAIMDSLTDAAHQSPMLFVPGRILEVVLVMLRLTRGWCC